MRTPWPSWRRLCRKKRDAAPARARAASAHALQQEQARQSAQTASEGLAVLGQVLGAIGQYQQANQARQQEQLQVLLAQQAQQVQLQAQQQAQRQASQPSGQGHGRIFYAPLGCASVTSMPYGNKTIPTMRNNCGRPIEAHFSGGQWSVGAGQSYSAQTNTVFYAACEKNDGYNRNSNQCYR